MKIKKKLKENGKRRSLTQHLWLYFGIFAVIIMLTLWLFQIIFLNTYYQSMKKREIEKIGEQLVNYYHTDQDKFNEYWEKHSFGRGASALILAEDGSVVKSPDLMEEFKRNEVSTNGNATASGDNQQPPDTTTEPAQPGLPNPCETPTKSNTSALPPNNRTHMNNFNSDVWKEFVKRVKASEDNITTYVIHTKMHVDMVVYGAQLEGDNQESLYLYLNSPLEPIDTTRQILQNQLAIVSVLSLIFAFALAYFIAKRFSKPIVKITASAQELGKGNYDIRFAHGSYREVNELADVLNNTATELSKTEDLRRDLMANVSHDLKTPLTIIQSYAEMIRDISGSNEAKRNIHTQVIIDETNRLSLLVNDMLNLSKMESGTAVLKKTQFDISSLVNSILGRFQVFSEKEDYHFETDIEKNILVNADEIQITQVIYNLIGNAVNYTGDNKTVWVSLHRLPNGVRFAVKDSGKGIAPEEKELVWKRYYKASKQHTRQVVGTGIGLSIVKNVLEMHDASYGVDSKVGNGSVFWFELSD